jgi:hypothetical protein
MPPPKGTTTTASDSVGTDGESDGGFETDGGGIVLLECEWRYLCFGGRGHAGLRPGEAARGPDPIGRWAAAMAHEEAGSVDAFLALADELAAHGAPAALVARARAAARDEVVHARLMGRIALARGARPRRPRLEAIPPRSLEALATENAVEGCVRETWAALEATWQAAHADDPAVRAAMQRIAVDETRHAELSRDLDAWLATRLSPAASARVRGARTRAVAALQRGLAERRAPAATRALGLPAPATARRLLTGLHAALWS